MSAHPADSRLFGHLWSTAESRALFDDEGRVASWLDILATLAEAQADVGLIPGGAAEVIRSQATIDRVDLDLVAEETRTSGHSTMGLIRALRACLPETAREWVYYGATVQDLSDTWASLTCRAIGDIMERDVTAMRDLTADLARGHRDTPMCGRTHGQPGLPITFGFKAAVWAAELDRQLFRLAQGRPRWEVAQLGGALGTMEFWGDSAVPLLEAFADRLNLASPEIAWLTARDRVAEFVCLLASTAATVAKIGNEVLQLQRPEIGEVREGFRPGTIGSITMPHKRNPENAEQLVSLSRVVRAQAGLALEGMVVEHERDGRAWKTEWLLLPEACLAFSASCALGVDMLERLEIDAERMRANLASHRGYLMSEPVMRALADRLGKHTAHEVVYAASMSGIEAGQDFLTALRADHRLDVIADEELEALLDVQSALGSAGDFVDQVVSGLGKYK
ncbi:MAG: adenylosuccinate lyase family protein [Actinomycetota bacterium]|nr:adenylosuccinate lyase family protein [Actinomycetota bacterium]